MLRQLLAEEREPEGLEPRAQRVAVQTMTREAGLESFLAHDPQGLAQAVDHGRGRRVVVEARGTPVVGELAEVEVVAADLGTARADQRLGARVVRHRRQP